MEKTTLGQYLSSAYNRDHWIEILDQVFKTGKVFEQPQVADLPQTDKWNAAFQLGTFETSDGFKISVFEIEVADYIQLDRNRVSLRNLLRRYYSQVDGIFTVFKQGNLWRFSFISQITDYDEEIEEFVEIETEPKRYTYVLGEGEAVKTATDRFFDLVETSIVDFKDIKEAFSVEKLNKEFYKKVVSFFYDLIGVKEPGRGGEQHPHLLQLPGISKKSPSGKKKHQEFAVRLIGRTVFCWFLKFKKSAQGNPILPQKVLSSENIPEGYYHNYLEQLFFQVMNTKREERKDDIPEAFESIPFLNGGLFEPHVNDYYSINEATGFSEHINTFKIPDKWFKEFFEVLEQYNFTIDENSVEDADVSVDPEMLGRIFENLLAEIDPVSGKTARKATGSYYTPREIVDYMVDESLTKYLSRKTGVNERRLLPLLKFDTEIDNDISKEEATAVIEALNELKVLDPACGSGAFPMGILQKMVRILEKVDPDSELWKDLQIRKIPNTVVRRMVKRKLDSATVEYTRKLGIIQHSIYGVDIQPIAAEISKLRCFLSLVVDAKVDETKDNWAIDSLPNLEFKFVTANSLISLPTKDSVSINLFSSSDLMERLELIREEYLRSFGEDKDTLKQQFTEIQQAIFENELKEISKNKDQRAMMLSQWEPFSDSVTNWFDPKWMFGVKQFDIVIGNPPYGGDDISKSLQNRLNLGSKDPYGAFIARFMPDGKTKSPLKHQGILAFIVSDTFMTIKTHRELREMILDNYIHKIIKVNKDTFKATVNTAIILFERNEFPIIKGIPDPQFDKSHSCLTGDLTRISIHEQHERFVQLLERTVQYQKAENEDGILSMHGKNWTSESNQFYAFYTYNQSFINENSNKPFFCGSPKLFKFLHDTKCNKGIFSLKGIEVKAAFNRINFNYNELRTIKLGQIAEVNQGISTGQNDYYIFRKEEGWGYSEVDDSKILSYELISQLTEDEKLYGIDPSKYGGKFIIPFDKGSSSNSSEGWMPNYYVPCEYYIDWSMNALHRMRTLTIKDRKLENGEVDKVKKGDEKKLAAVLRNPDKWFKSTINFSPTGEYSPSFRLGFGTVSQNTSSTILLDKEFDYLILGILSSRLGKYIFKNFLNHTVHTQEGDVVEYPLVLDIDLKIEQLVCNIISEQKINLEYDYASYEQVEIDKLVYDAYGLHEDDIREVENWYARRYPKLVAAQKENLRKLEKSDDYLELYGKVAKELESKS